MKIDNFFAELKRRNVYKVAVAYAVVGWLVIQVSSTILPTFHAPEWVVQTLIVLVVIGFPVALVIAWAFESTSKGIERTQVADALDRHSRGRAWIYISVVGVLLSIGLFFAGRYTAPDRAGIDRLLEKSIAVLPFENLSDDKGAAYFADGIQDEILTKLSSIADLKVISRTSTAKYKSKPEDLKTVSQQLAVANVLEGSVQKAAGKIRVNVQLIDARADSHLWAKTYDRDMKDVFAIQSEVAQEIADALKAKLSPAEANAVASAPTKNPAAYDLFLKGEYEHKAGLAAQRPEHFDEAAKWYNEAIAQDPNFALAMAQLVISRMRRHWLVESASESVLNQIGIVAKQAVALAPNLPQAHVALGVFHYYGSRQYEPALAEFQRAIELQPNNPEALQFIAYVHRRQGQWERSLNELQKSLDQDPRNSSIAANIAQTYCFLRRWEEGENTARHALALDPHDATAMNMLLISSLDRTGDAAEALRAQASFPIQDRLLPNSSTVIMVIGARAQMFTLNHDFDAALKEWGNRPDDGDEAQRVAASTTIRVLAGDLRGAQADAGKARPLWEMKLHEHPDDIRSMRALSWIYLALNRKEDATRIARKALELIPPDKDAVLGTGNLAALAEIQAHTGATSDAVNTIRGLLAVPAGEVISIARLKIDPVWDPIRNDPGFQQLLKVKEHVGP